MTSPILNAYAKSPLDKATVDDLRELLGKPRIDETFSKEEQNQIINGYMAIQYHNDLAETFEMLRGVDIYSEIEELKKQLTMEIHEVSEEIEVRFKSGEDIENILELITKYDTLMYEKSRLMEKNDELTIEKKENEWEGDYFELMEILSKVESMKELGRVGIDMKPPVDGPLIITSPYGTRVDPFGTHLSFHSGVDLRAAEGSNVYAQWAGTVSRVYETETGGKSIEIIHDETVKTRYLHLSSIEVEVGQEVKQRQLIGKAGSTGRSTGPHLHFEVYVDNQSIDPILLFGKNGANALYRYLTEEKQLTKEQMERIQEVISSIKDRPRNMQEKLIEEARNRYKPGVRPVDYTKKINEFGEDLIEQEFSYESSYYDEKIEMQLKDGHESPSPHSKIILPRG